MSARDSGEVSRTVVRRERLVIGLLSAAIASHYLYVTSFPTGSSGWIVWRVLPLMSLLALALMAPRKTAPIPRHTAHLAVIWMLFALSALGSAVYHGTGFQYVLWYVVGIPLLFFNTIPLLTGSRGTYVIASSLVASSAFMILLSLALEPIRIGQAYQGILSLHTHMGQACAMLVVGALSLLKDAVWRKGPFTLPSVVLSLLLFMALFVVIASLYRTAIVTVAVLMFVYAGVSVRKLAVLFRLTLGLVALLSMVLFAASILGVNVGDELSRVWSSVMAKHEMRMAYEGGVTAYRADQARVTFENRSWWGHGTEESVMYHLGTRIGYHNGFVRMLGVYGMPAALFFALFCLLALIQCFRYSRRTEGIDRHNTLPLMCMLFFLVYTQGSAVVSPWLSGAMYPVFLSIGIVIMRMPRGKPRDVSGTAREGRQAEESVGATRE